MRATRWALGSAALVADTLDLPGKIHARKLDVARLAVYSAIGALDYRERFLAAVTGHAESASVADLVVSRRLDKLLLR